MLDTLHGSAGPVLHRALTRAGVRVDGWRLIPDAPYWVEVNMTIKQSGGAISGPWSSRWGSGTIKNGKISGDSVTFEYADNYCSFRVSGTLMSGCLMNGFIQGYNRCIINIVVYSLVRFS